jgi:hypothetical protein
MQNNNTSIIMNLVTIKAFDSMAHLGVVRSYLESEGIECFVKDELIGLSGVAVGIGDLSVKLQVIDTDVEEAIRLLLEGGYAKPKDFEADETMLRLSGYYEKIRRFFKGKE